MRGADLLSPWSALLRVLRLLALGLGWSVLLSGVLVMNPVAAPHAARGGPVAQSPGQGEVAQAPSPSPFATLEPTPTTAGTHAGPSPSAHPVPSAHPTPRPASAPGPIQPTHSPTPPPMHPPPATPHVMVIMEENKGYQPTLGACSADPYLCSLATLYASGTAWAGVSHPSAPNYLAFISGSTQGISSDCTPGGSGCGPFSSPDLGGQLTAAGIPWRAYMESMPSPCFTGAGSGNYAEKHNPFMYFTDVSGSPTCARDVVPYPGAPGLVSDLTGPSAPDFVWITPNLQNDMHNGTVQQGDAWLKANLAPVLTSTWFTNFNATVIVTMDEGDAPGSIPNQIPMVVISHKSLGHGNFTTPGNHYGVLRTIEEVYRLSMLGGAAGANNGDLSSLFSY